MVHCIISLHLRVSFFFSFCVILLQKTILDEKQKSRQIAPKVLNYSWELHGIFHHGPSQFDSNSYPQNWLSALISLVSCVKKKKVLSEGQLDVWLRTLKDSQKFQGGSWLHISSLNVWGHSIFLVETACFLFVVDILLLLSGISSVSCDDNF